MPSNHDPGFAPYAGPAPAPRRSVASQPVGPSPGDVKIKSNVNVLHTGLRQDSEPAVQATPPPKEPEQTAGFKELQTQIGQLQNALGEQRKEYERQLAELRLRSEIGRGSTSQSAPSLPYNGQFSQLPQNLDPEDRPNFAQLATIVGNMDQVNRDRSAASHRAAWDVTAEEESSALSRIPEIQNLPEPDRTYKIHQVVREVIRAAEPSKLQMAAPQAEMSQAVPPEAPAPVPLTEAPSSESVQEIPAGDTRLQDLQHQYQDTERQMNATSGPERSKLLRQLKLISDEILRVQNISQEELFEHNWEMRTS